MGDEIEQRYFDGDAFCAFRERLDAETALLGELFAREGFSHRGGMAGFELEAWLIDRNGDPLPDNAEYLDALDNPLVVPELAAFNVELNGSPVRLSGRVFTRLHDELAATWSACCRIAEARSSRLVSIGTLPTLREAMLTADNMSRQVRYRSLNDRVLAMRDGRPLRIEIDGDEPLSMTHNDVMLEAAATSFQIHLQCRAERAVRDFNASMIASAPILAVAANSPFLFGHSLWDETRIPLFEQSVDVGPSEWPRVSFGRGYVQSSLFELFCENRDDHQILLPAVVDEPANQFCHLRFQNGTLWRWNRPLIGFDFDGRVHLRIEHRVVPAGPTLRDCIANSAFYYGLVYGLGLATTPIEQHLPFEQARENFYACARDGLRAHVYWPDRHSEVHLQPVRSLLQDRLLPLARDGLCSLQIPADELDEYLGIVAARVENNQNGAQWQRDWVAKHGRDFQTLVRRYHELQQQNQPVHTWPV